MYSNHHHHFSNHIRVRCLATPRAVGEIHSPFPIYGASPPVYASLLPHTWIHTYTFHMLPSLVWWSFCYVRHLCSTGSEVLRQIASLPASGTSMASTQQLRNHVARMFVFCLRELCVCGITILAEIYWPSTYSARFDPAEKHILFPLRSEFMVREVAQICLRFPRDLYRVSRGCEIEAYTCCEWYPKNMCVERSSRTIIASYICKVWCAPSHIGDDLGRKMGWRKATCCKLHVARGIYAHIIVVRVYYTYMCEWTHIFTPNTCALRAGLEATMRCCPWNRCCIKLRGSICI